MQRSSGRGAGTSRDVEILGLTPHGLWLMVRDKEYLLDYQRFPWFRAATIEAVQQVELRFDHLYWPTLDVDLHVDSIAEPDRFPLASKVRTRRKPSRRPSARSPLSPR